MEKGVERRREVRYGILTSRNDLAVVLLSSEHLGYLLKICTRLGPSILCHGKGRGS